MIPLDPVHVTAPTAAAGQAVASGMRFPLPFALLLLCACSPALLAQALTARVVDLAARPHAPATHVVALDRNRFDPREIRALPGDTIRFVNGMGGPHNVQFMAESISVADRKRIDDAMKGRIAPLTSPMFIIEGETFVFVVPALPAGRYPFLCSPHWANMRGALVIPSAGAANP